MRRLLCYFPVFVILCFSCKNQKTKPSEAIEVEAIDGADIQVKEENSEAIKSGSYFIGAGTEPFWGLSIADNKIELKMMSDTITTPHVAPVRAMDANVKRYRVETEAVNLTIQISKRKCINAMSGEEFPYSVTINYNYTGLETEHTFQGCGYYTTTLKTGCYAYNDNDNSVMFKITDVSDEVFGRLKYSYHEKDESTGNFRGRLYRDRLFGTFTFMSEGIESVREVAFLVKQDTLIEGVGALNEAGTAFKFRDSIQYTSKTPLTITDCK